VPRGNPKPGVHGRRSRSASRRARPSRATFSICRKASRSRANAGRGVWRSPSTRR
jgi:hypothetical protein